ncbi:pentapeptide repeat-containing protein [Chitinimonas arctica]|uniref:Pentapeptide repeat-containing protein n=1 Tax=Chitinimonas arctica TaxID=2594795 RepID=A0A516SCP0_9NEIS|nr:pentapeptide repeat-containing protein [Chitinimonas arctica]QDQ25912.1 pentapeptide repeat-containing protein [Chitinimonas arctica]
MDFACFTRAFKPLGNSLSTTDRAINHNTGGSIKELLSNLCACEVYDVLQEASAAQEEDEALDFCASVLIGELNNGNQIESKRYRVNFSENSAVVFDKYTNQELSIPGLTIHSLEKLIVNEMSKDVLLHEKIQKAIKGRTHFTDIIYNTKASFKGEKLCNRVFKGCIINLNHFSAAELKNVTFASCKFTNSSFANSKIQNCFFHNCTLEAAMFTGAKIEDTSFLGCNITQSSFEDAVIINVEISSSNLCGTHFLDASIVNSKITASQLDNVVFFDQPDRAGFHLDAKSEATAAITKPIAILLVDPENPGITGPKINLKLQNAASAVPLRISTKPDKVDPHELTKEVEQAISNSQHPSNKPIPQTLIDSARHSACDNPNFAKILSKAKKNFHRN